MQVPGVMCSAYSCYCAIVLLQGFRHILLKNEITRENEFKPADTYTGSGTGISSPRLNSFKYGQECLFILKQQCLPNSGCLHCYLRNAFCVPLTVLVDQTPLFPALKKLLVQVNSHLRYRFSATAAGQALEPIATVSVRLPRKVTFL